jgi:hypothetical protein
LYFSEIWLRLLHQTFTFRTQHNVPNGKVAGAFFINTRFKPLLAVKNFC